MPARRPRSFPAWTVPALLAAAAALPLAGCSASGDAETARAAAGGLSASLLRPRAEAAFERKGHPISGRLECSADPEAEGVLQVDCSGVTFDDESAEFSGRIEYAAIADRPPGDDGLPGHFVGRVSGEQVYVMDCFSCSAHPPSPPAESGRTRGVDAEPGQRKDKEDGEKEEGGPGGSD
ncbi:hypothetical protein [Nocardiopsis composta]|uniref:Lipoprotein n=1 Tax=Nocardiopsis composta TaxID=157465 RepID=A0A7W8QIA8_9ACTN|nr:hypothetical protein [Nocardiopsis composta]MBB5430805.1 hypothetical protein [Nocardiopsis composta]